jgi:hypothetical protein
LPEIVSTSASWKESVILKYLMHPRLLLVKNKSTTKTNRLIKVYMLRKIISCHHGKLH